MNAYQPVGSMLLTAVIYFMIYGFLYRRRSVPCLMIAGGQFESGTGVMYWSFPLTQRRGRRDAR